MCNGIKPNVSGFDVSTEEMLHNACVSSEYLKLKGKNILEDDVFLSVTQAYSDEKKIRVLLTGVKLMTFRLVLRMLYH